MGVLEVAKVINYISFSAIKVSIMYGNSKGVTASRKEQLIENCCIFP
jgi:hypothetical protein